MLKQLVDRLTRVSVVGVDLGSEALKAVELEPSGFQKCPSVLGTSKKSNERGVVW